MTLAETSKGLALTAIFWLLIAAPALGVPAGDEYLPQVPSATGEKPVGTDPSTAGPAEPETAKKADTTKDDENKTDDESAALALDPSGGGGDDSGGVLDTLLDPIVLLLIGGVLAIAVGMLLARRQNGDSPDPSRARRASSDAPHTPDGEIVGGGERP